MGYTSPIGHVGDKLIVGALDVSFLASITTVTPGTFVANGPAYFGLGIGLGVARATVMIGPPIAVSLPASLEVTGITNIFGIHNVIAVSTFTGLTTKLGTTIKNALSLKNGIDIKNALNIGNALGLDNGLRTVNGKLLVNGLLTAAVISQLLQSLRDLGLLLQLLRLSKSLIFHTQLKGKVGDLHILV